MEIEKEMEEAVPVRARAKGQVRAALVLYGKNLKPLETQFKTKDNKVEGCVSQVWVRADLNSDNNVVFEADSDSVLTKGLAALLVNGLSGRPVDEVIQVSPDFVVLLGLQQSLTPSRSNAFLNMLRLMQKKALQLAVEAEKGEKSGLKMDGRVENVNFGSNSDLGVEETPVVVSNSGLKVDSRNGNVIVELDSEVGGERSPVQSSNSGGFGEG
ncbi:sufe-like protein 1 [Quercus suber]|uniref:Sufe-like protein 1 n=1 Tax=Quercus suber TaxID=58331 RepID=A0AAW0LW18_QUESU